jgi:molybdopterin/thiamine biosynthesis adenylyltransferase
MARTLRPGDLDEDRHERSKRLEWFDLESVQNTKVLVVGCGAIGNETVKNLILAGFKKITLVDMDHVVRSNLNRCIFFDDEDADRKRFKAEAVVEKAKKLEKNLKIDFKTEMIQDLPDDFIPSFDLVLGCLDNVAARLHLNAHCYMHGIPYIDAATLGFVGKVQVVLPPETPCLECGMNKTHLKIMGDRFSCTGDLSRAQIGCGNYDNKHCLGHPDQGIDKDSAWLAVRSSAECVLLRRNAKCF